MSIDSPGIINISIVIEWENVLLSEADRSLAMLKQLSTQLQDIHHAVEVLFLFNEEDIATQTLQAIINTHFTVHPSLANRVSVQLLPVVGLHYYDIKNAGVQQAKGDLVVFLDSDVIPEPHWLKALTEPFFNDASVQVIAGHTYLEPEGFLGRAFALGWFFPTKAIPDAKLTPASQFFANNVAFRRSVLLQYPFEPMPKGVTRGACTELAKTLVQAGIPLLKTTQAQTSHPRPNGAHHIIIRALAMGRDRFLRETAKGASGIQAFGDVLRYFKLAIGRLSRRVIHDRQKVGATRIEAPLIFLLMFSWQSLALVGGALSFIAPNLAQRLWRI